MSFILDFKVIPPERFSPLGTRPSTKSRLPPPLSVGERQFPPSLLRLRPSLRSSRDQTIYHFDSLVPAAWRWKEALIEAEGEGTRRAAAVPGTKNGCPLKEPY